MTKAAGGEKRACPSLGLVQTASSVLWEETELTVWHQQNPRSKSSKSVASSFKGCTHRISKPQQQLLEDQQVPTDQETDRGNLTYPPANHVDSGTTAIQLGEVHAHI